MKAKKSATATGTLAKLMENAKEAAKKAPPPPGGTGATSKIPPVIPAKSPGKEVNLGEMMNWLAKSTPRESKATLPKVDLALPDAAINSKNLPQVPEKMLVRYNDGVYNSSKLIDVPQSRDFGIEPPKASAENAVLRAIEDDWNSDKADWNGGISKLAQREDFSTFTEPKSSRSPLQDFIPQTSTAMQEAVRVEGMFRDWGRERQKALNPYKDEALAKMAGEWDGYEYFNHSDSELYNNWYEDETVLVNDWLRLFDKPMEPEGREVQIPDGAIPNNWFSFERKKDINGWARGQLKAKGADFEVNIGQYGELTNEDGRYWVAVGPRVLNPDHRKDQGVWADDFVYGTKLDAVLKDKDGKLYYLPCVFGEMKEHTYPNGVYQTGRSYPNGNNFVKGNVDSSVIEFIGAELGKDLSQYAIVKIIVYDE